MALDRAAGFFEIATPLAEAIPILGAPVKGAFEATSKILKYAGEVKSNKEKTKDLATRASGLFTQLRDQLDKGKGDFSDVELESLRKQVNTIVDVLDAIKDWTEKRAHQGRLDRIWNKSTDADELANMRQRLQEVYQDFMMLSQIGIERKLARISTAADREILQSLRPVSGARYNAMSAPSGCLEGTRTEVLDLILTWCSGVATTFSIYWLAGHAGTGKSAIARTLCERLVAQDTAWIVTFFASKSSEDRRDPLRILHTIVYELAYSDASVRKHVLSALALYPDVKTQPLKEQINQLLFLALKDVLSNRSLVIVIDALDECLTIRGVEGGELIRDMALVLGNLPIKLVVTSRMERSLERMFSSIPDRVVQRLHEIEGMHVSDDVRLILRQGFKGIVDRHNAITSLWPADEDINTLVERTGSLIIFAATVLKFVDNDRLSSPQRLLQQILEQTSARRPAHEYEPVDTLYLSILEAAARFTPDVMKQDEILCERLHSLTSTIILLQEPLSIPALADLMNAPEDEIYRDVYALSAVLLIGPDLDDSGAPFVRIFHPSFRDFLLDRCHDSRFSANGPGQHLSLALSCLTTLNQTLNRDPCGIKDPTISLSQIDNPPLVVRIQQSVPIATRYAGKFWMAHISRSKAPDERLLKELRIFVCTHAFHWMELLSLLGLIPHAIKNLYSVTSWCERFVVSMQAGNNDEVDLLELLHDIHQMLRTYRVVFITHALHVYYGAQVTMPQCHLLRTGAGSGANELQVPLLTSERGTHWMSATITCEGHTTHLKSAMLSSDNMRIASSSLDGSMRIWDAVTGQETAEPVGHTDVVTCLAFSPDGSRIVSGGDYEDCTVRLWDASTSLECAILEGHTGSISSVAFSPDGSRILSGSSDYTVRLWSVQSNKTECTVFEGHTNVVWPVAFLLNGFQVMSGSDDNTVRLWDSETGQQCAKVTLEGHPGGVTCVAFSSDGSKIVVGCANKMYLWDTATGHKRATWEGQPGKVVNSVSLTQDGSKVAWGSMNGVVYIWDAQTFQEIATLEGHTGPVWSVAFSTDDSRITTGSADKTVRLWDTSPRKNAVQSEGHTDRINCVVFSPDGLWIASSAADSTVRLWNTRTGRELAKLEGYSGPVAISPDKLRIALGSADKTVRVWETVTYQECARLQGHTGDVECLAFSPDGLHIASGSNDETVRVWNIATGHTTVQFKGHRNYVKSITFSPDGILVASGSGDSTVRVWDARTGQQCAVVGDVLGAWITFLAFSPDGRSLHAHFHLYATQSWIIAENADTMSSSTASKTLILQSDGAVPGHLFYDEKNGWILWEAGQQGRRCLCWIPPDLRGLQFASHESLFAIASASTHQLTIIDFAPMLNTLRGLGVI